jgi:excisionase family DNA binding protein
VFREHSTPAAPPGHLVELPPASRDRGAAASGEIPLLLRPEQVAALLQTSRSHVYQLIQSGALESLLLGSRRRIERPAVEAYVAREREAQRGRRP